MNHILKNLLLKSIEEALLDFADEGAAEYNELVDLVGHVGLTKDEAMEIVKEIDDGRTDTFVSVVLLTQWALDKLKAEPT